MKRVVPRVAFLLAIAVIAPEPRAHAQSACGAAQMKAAGKKVAGKSNCYAKAYKTGDPVRTDCLAKVEAKFSAAYAKAVRKGDCPGDATADSVEDLVDQCVGDLATAIPSLVTAGGCSNTECDDGIDNDGDGKIDGFDHECVGPCDNSEATYDNTIAGLSYACTVDCFFDANSGSGDDDCVWSHVCDSLEVAPNYDPAGSTCAYNPGATVFGSTCTDLAATQSDMCLSSCVVPEGCDCFGCCEPPGTDHFVWFGSRDTNGNPTCSRAVYNDASKCRPCTPVSACFNSCDPNQCEMCMGQDPSALPMSCNGLQACPAGSAACGGAVECAADHYCLNGCCYPRPR